MMSFASDPQAGMTADRFSGEAVVFLATTRFVPQQTASLQYNLFPGCTQRKACAHGADSRASTSSVNHFVGCAGSSRGMPVQTARAAAGKSL